MVTKDVPNYSIVAGVSAKIIRITSDAINPHNNSLTCSCRE